MSGRVDRLLAVGIVALAIGAVVLLALVVIDTSNSAAPEVRAQVATPSPTASPQAFLLMGTAHLPTSAECVLCHESASGVGLKPVPAIAHPLQGWTSCTSCHAENRLVTTAPGHAGIAETECLSCHKTAAPGPAITRPHSLLQNTNCLSCHGGKVHLPASMEAMSVTQCWLCHQATDEPPPQFPHPLDASRSCQSCHSAGKVGALPTDHAGRTDETCVLCHEVSATAASAPAVPHSLSGRTELCIYCHSPATDRRVE
jgi:hypothetical protein